MVLRQNKQIPIYGVIDIQEVFNLPNVYYS